LDTVQRYRRQPDYRYFDGSPSTLRADIVGGFVNINFYLLLPTNAVAAIGSDAVITNVYPDGAFQFQWTNTLSF